MWWRPQTLGTHWRTFANRGLKLAWAWLSTHPEHVIVHLSVHCVPKAITKHLAPKLKGQSCHCHQLVLPPCILGLESKTHWGRKKKGIPKHPLTSCGSFHKSRLFLMLSSFINGVPFIPLFIKHFLSICYAPGTFLGVGVGTSVNKEEKVHASWKGNKELKYKQMYIYVRLW